MLLSYDHATAEGRSTVGPDPLQEGLKHPLSSQALPDWLVILCGISELRLWTQVEERLSVGSLALACYLRSEAFCWITVTDTSVPFGAVWPHRLEH